MALWLLLTHRSQVMESVLGGDVVCQASEVGLVVVRSPPDHDVELVRHHLAALRGGRPRCLRVDVRGREEGVQEED